MASGWMPMNDGVGGVAPSAPPPSYESSQNDVYSSAKSPDGGGTAPAPANSGPLPFVPSPMQMVVNCPRCNSQKVFPAEVTPRPGTITACDACGQQFQLGGGPPQPQQPVQPQQPQMPLPGVYQSAPAPTPSAILPGVESDPVLLDVYNKLNVHFTQPTLKAATAYPVKRYYEDAFRERAMFKTMQGVCLFVVEKLEIPAWNVVVHVPTGVLNRDIVINLNQFLTDELIPYHDPPGFGWSHLHQLLERDNDPLFDFRLSMEFQDQLAMDGFLDEIRADLARQFPVIEAKGMFGGRVVNNQHTITSIHEKPKLPWAERRTRAKSCCENFPGNALGWFDGIWFFCCIPFFFALAFLGPFIHLFYVFCWQPCEVQECATNKTHFVLPVRLKYPNGFMDHLRYIYRQNGGGFTGLLAMEQAAAAQPPHQLVVMNAAVRR